MSLSPAWREVPRMVPITALLMANWLQTPASAVDWIPNPSYYTHGNNAQRVAQYQPIGPYYYYDRGDFMRSGYRQLRSTIQLGSSADNLHIVEEWGNPVRPYEEWRFPYRPYSVPYPAWGPQYGPFGGGYGGFGGGGGFLGGGGGGPIPPNQSPNGVIVPPGAGYIPQPSQDGHWPNYDSHDRSEYYRPYRN